MNDPVAPAQPASPAQSAQARTKLSSAASRRSKKPLFVILAAIIVALVVLGGLFMLYRSSSAVSAIDSSKYQAVFFTNGQVYFGKLSQQNDQYMKLTNVYYLQSKTTSDKTSPQSANSQNASDVELIKLGNEIHGPEDQMIIAKDQILFFENLKPQGTVSKTITNYQKK